MKNLTLTIICLALTATSGIAAPTQDREHGDQHEIDVSKLPRYRHSVSSKKDWTWVGPSNHRTKVFTYKVLDRSHFMRSTGLEKGPFNTVGKKGLSPRGVTKEGISVYEELPALSEVDEAFIVHSCKPPLPHEFCGKIHFTVGYTFHVEFPESSKKAERLAACLKYSQGEAKVREILISNLRQLDISEDFNNKYGTVMDHRLRESEAELRKLGYEQKMQGIRDEMHERKLAHIEGMTLQQYRTYKSQPSDFTPINPANPYLGRGPSSLFKDGCGDVYKIDGAGNKYRVDSSGGLHPEK